MAAIQTSQREELITTTEAGKLLGLSRHSVAVYIGRGIIKAEKPPGGRDYLVLRSEVERYARNRTKPGGARRKKSTPGEN